MTEITYKPYTVIREEWAELCEKLREAQNQLASTQNPLFTQYPSDEMWQNYLPVSEKYDAVYLEWNNYRSTVRQSD